MNSSDFDPAGVKVSVAMITYNHERFIAQAIESILEQQTDFRVELVIGEDCSTDNTRSIVVEYAQRYPDRIRTLLPERNLGMIPNLVATLNACRGRYIAICEGDDYWTNPGKLHRQVSYLQTHPECAACMHDVQVVFEDNSRPSYRLCPPGQKAVYTLEDVLASTSTLSQSASLMFRGNLLIDFPDWFLGVPLGDLAVYALLAEHGSVGYLPDCMSVYRIHVGGVWNGISERKRLSQRLQMLDTFDAYFGYRHTAIMQPNRCACYYGMALDCWLNNMPAEQAYWMGLAVGEFPNGADVLLAEVLRSTLAIQSHYGYQKAEDAANWTCNVIRSLPAGEPWCTKLFREWYTAAAFQAFEASQYDGARRASRRAVRHNWQLLKNYGFVKRWGYAAVTGRLRRRSISTIDRTLVKVEEI